MPETIKAVEECYAQWSKEQMQPSAQAPLCGVHGAVRVRNVPNSTGTGYYFKEIASDYSDIRKRWLVVFSEAASNREVATFFKQLKKQRGRAEKRLWHLANREFLPPQDAHQAVAKKAAKWPYHRVDYQLEEVPHYPKPGRPAQDAAPDRIGYRLIGHVVENQDAIEKALQHKGKFIIATNQLDSKVLPAETLLCAYKAQADHGLDDGDGLGVVGLCPGRAQVADRAFAHRTNRAQSGGKTHLASNDAMGLSDV